MTAAWELNPEGLDWNWPLTVEIRPFRREDTRSVLELANSFAAFDGTTSEADLAVIGYFPNGICVAESEGRVVGFAYGCFKDVPGEVLERWGATKVGEVELLVVHPHYRDKGIGKSLLARLLDEFKNAGADTILLNCPVVATEAKGLYDKMGFEVKSYQMKKRLT